MSVNEKTQWAEKNSKETKNDNTVKDKKQHATFCVLVCSTLCPTSRELSYTPVRTVFTPEQRLEQTCQTVRSVRNRLTPHSYKVVCVDNSETLMDARACRLALREAGVDFFLHEHTPHANSVDKAKGEASNTLSFIKWFESGMNNEHKNASFGPFTHVLKISGRYELTSQFSIVSFQDTSKYTFWPSGGNVSTVVYSVPMSRWSHWKQTMLQILDETKGCGFEHLMFLLTKSVASYLTGPLGAKGRVAVDGSLWEA